MLPYAYARTNQQLGDSSPVFSYFIWRTVVDDKGIQQGKYVVYSHPLPVSVSQMSKLYPCYYVPFASAVRKVFEMEPIDSDRGMRVVESSGTPSYNHCRLQKPEKSGVVHLALLSRSSYLLLVLRT